ncbi:helix-turn-helix transcriptional regulator [Vibrio sp. RC27]
MQDKEIISGNKNIAKFCGISTATLQRLERKGEFAPRIQLSARRVGCYKQDLYDWLNSRKSQNQPSMNMEG